MAKKKEQSREQPNISVKSMGHLGLVAGMIDRLGLVELIDEALPCQKAKGSKVSHGLRVKAMLLSALGFTDNRLYIFPEFLQDMAVNRLLKTSINPKHFNDDALGRSLDAIHSYGASKLFSEMALTIAKKFNFLGRGVHLDTTTLSLFGLYKNFLYEEQPHPAYGYSKAKRFDLKQMVLTLATSGKGNFPLYMEARSGNESDQKIIPEAAEKIVQSLKDAGLSDDFFIVADSAGFNNLSRENVDFPWISRVPERVKRAKEIVTLPEESLSLTKIDDCYSFCVFEETHKNVKQKWVLVKSQMAYERERETLNERVKKESLVVEKQIKSLMRESFGCQEDAHSALEKKKKEIRFHRLNGELVPVYKPVIGRHPKDFVPEILGYKWVLTAEADEEKIEIISRNKGRFILATNVHNLQGDEILKEYKNQSGVERGFRWLKNDSMNVDSVFLKKPERIEALMMVMTLALMIFGCLEYELRKNLVETKQTLPLASTKESQKPGMKWIFFKFKGLHESWFTSLLGTQVFVSQTNDFQEKVLELLPFARSYLPVTQTHIKIQDDLKNKSLWGRGNISQKHEMT